MAVLFFCVSSTISQADAGVVLITTEILNKHDSVSEVAL